MGLELTPAAKGFSTGIRFQFARPLYILAGIVALILLVACVNLANLMLARAAARSHEMSVRVAIGASRWSLAQQVFTESLVLSLVGALVGLAFAYWGSRLLVLLMAQQSSVRLSFNLNPDPYVLTFTIGVALLTGICFAVAPAVRCSRQDPAMVLQQGARGLTAGVGKLSKALIVTQIALSMVLLLGAGLLVSSFEKLRTINLGFRNENVVQIELYPRPGGYKNLDVAAYRRQLLARIAAVPGVTSVSFADLSVPSLDAWHDFASEASVDSATSAKIMSNATEVSPGFFQTLGIPLLQGRVFTDADDKNHAPLAVISNGLAKSLFPAGGAIGKTVRFGVMSEYQTLRVIGVAADARLVSLRDASPPILYLSALQFPHEWGNLLVRTALSPAVLAKTIGQEVDSMGHEYVLSTKAVSEVVSSELGEERVIALLSGFFAALALLLASIGLYGLMSYAVTRRTREMGIRVALGAQRQSVLWIVLRETLALAGIGLAIGIPAAIAACRLISTMLFGLSASDPLTIAAVSLLLLAVALLAGYLPARRASSIDPLVALRSE
jgi:predicted permease